MFKPFVIIKSKSKPLPTAGAIDVAARYFVYKHLKGPEATQFRPGNPGGPGRPAGSRNRATLVLDALAEGEVQAVLEKQLELWPSALQRSSWPACGPSGGAARYHFQRQNLC